MCGIFAVVNDTSHHAARTTLEGLKKLEYRGYDSWGVAVVPTASQKSKVSAKGGSAYGRKSLKSKNQIVIKKKIGKIGEATVDDMPSGDIAIGHTRWATHGGVTDENAHPHMDCSGRFVVIHNGIVENYQELKQSLLKKKHTFHSETDTEVIAHLIEDRSKEMSVEQAVLMVFKELVGSNAIGVLDGHTGTIVACRNGSPLSIGVGKEQYFLASDVTAFLGHTQDVQFLEDGEAVVMTPSGVKLLDIASGKEKKLALTHLDWKVTDAQKGGYPHFTLKEIMEQVVTVPKTALVNRTEMETIGAMVKQSTRIVLIGCGTAAYCALASQYFFAQVGREAKSYGAYEYLPFAGFSDTKTIVFAISQSGETADTLIAARAAKKNGAYLVAVVNARVSTLERMADVVLPVGAGPEISVVSTKAFTSQLASMYLVTRMCAGKYEEAVNNVKTLGELLAGWQTKKLLGEVLDVAKLLMSQEDMYVIGKHMSYPAALEFALKIKESSYIHSEPFAAGELKHGVITLIQKGTPCFAIGASDETKLELLSSAAQLKARGGTIIGVAPYASSEFDIHIATPDAGPLTIIPNVIVGQLLGYYLGIGRGTDPDKPRNLAKSVTVK
ncbi:MAG: glutamine--fructose-6-phosphate transaminase (isomerizing) [Candidatus Gottesmanbacteria bacterium]|nr:glutamine--fructose-6-phosphate transaminase (isomerizing) [Candidatus Gottesmanbacteria bacterium]